MEQWQKTIIQNLPNLSRMTKFNIDVKTKLLANRILDFIDVEQLDEKRDRYGETAANCQFYQCLMTKVGAYKVLAKILEETGQTGAAKILKDGLRNFKIPIELDSIQNVQIGVQGKILKINEFFDTEKLELVQQIFRDTITELDMYDSFVKKEQTFVLATSSIPQDPPMYISRFLSNRIQIDESIFKTDCPDVFVFKNTIPKNELSEIFTLTMPSDSTSQLSSITSRFIYLDQNEDWIDLKKIAKIPIHLINYEAEGKIFLLEDTSSKMNILTKLGSEENPGYVSEDEFVRQQLSENSGASSVCICGIPGMGKSLFLANMARRMTEISTGRIIVFIAVTAFVSDFFEHSPSNIQNEQTTLLNVFKCVTPSQQRNELLLQLTTSKLIQVDIFFDGLNEIQQQKQSWLMQCLKNLLTFSNVKIYVTSTPQTKYILEETLKTISLNILPFNIKGQTEFLTTLWLQKMPDCKRFDLELFTEQCLAFLKKTATQDEVEMMGIPLILNIIATLYADKANMFSKTGEKDLRYSFHAVNVLYQDAVNNKNPVSEYTITYSTSHLLGEGCGGTIVYRGKFGNVSVAVKYILDFKDEEEAKNEIKLLTQCMHKNIVRYIASEVDPGRGIKLALELCDANTLMQWVKDTYCISMKVEGLEILKQSTVGLHFLHSKKIIHRDLKPSNILFKVEGEHVIVKIADFGFSRQIEDGRESKTTKTICGTTGWKSPELLVSEDQIPKLTPKMDIFSLGCIFYFVLTKGKHPFGNISASCDHNILNGKVDFQQNYCRILQENLSLIEKMIAKNPLDRPDTEAILRHRIFTTSEDSQQESTHTSTTTDLINITITTFSEYFLKGLILSLVPEL